MRGKGKQNPGRAEFPGLLNGGGGARLTANLDRKTVALRRRPELVRRENLAGTAA
jgi:hypothetical protein